MKTKDLERLKTFLDVISGNFAFKGTEDERHDLASIVQNEIVKKNQKKIKPTQGFWSKLINEQYDSANEATIKNLKDEIKTFHDLTEKLSERIKDLEKENEGLRDLNKKYIKEQFALKNKMLSIHGSATSIEKSLNATPKDIEGVYISVKYIKQATGAYVKDNATHINCGLYTELPYPCNVLKAVADCVAIAQELKEQSRVKNENIRLKSEAEYWKARYEKEYNILDVDRLNIKGKLFHFDDEPFSGQVDYDKGKPIQINKRTITL